jgi:hypothetical protein
MNYSKYYLPILMMILLGISINAQDDRNRSSYFSGHIGAYSGNGTAYGRANGTQAFNIGAGFGLPLIGDLYLFSRFSYVSKSGYEGFFDNRYLDQSLQSVNELVRVNGTFSQLIMNGGLQYKLYLVEDISMGFAGGLTYAMVNHEARVVSGELIQQIDNSGVFGYFLGLTVEKEFERSDLSIFAEGIYNKAEKDMVYFRDAFSGMNFTVGMKYYFSNR